MSFHFPRSVRATREEKARRLPGDERIPQAIDTLTHGVTIRGAPRDVWPWLVQMGAGTRAGFFPALPGATEGFTLLAIEPERVLTLGWVSPDGTLNTTWTFVLDEVAPGVTRLVVRARGVPGYRFYGLPSSLTRLVVRIAHFIMQRKQLLGIARRAESATPHTSAFKTLEGEAALALNYAIAVPQRVRKLVLLSPGGLLPMVRQFTVRGMLMVWFPTRLTVNTFFHWLGFTDRAYANMLEMMYLGLKHFRMPLETARIMPAVVPDEALRTMKMPTLLLIGEHEVISDPASALARARRLIPDFEGERVRGCRHDMCSSRPDIVNARVLAFLRKTHTDDRAAIADRSVA